MKIFKELGCIIVGFLISFISVSCGSNDVHGLWAPTAGSMNPDREFHTANLLNNGQVLIAGGSYFASAELYNPTTGMFNTTGSMNTTRELHTATLLNNGQVLIAG